MNTINSTSVEVAETREQINDPTLNQQPPLDLQNDSLAEEEAYLKQILQSGRSAVLMFLEQTEE